MIVISKLIIWKLNFQNNNGRNCIAAQVGFDKLLEILMQDGNWKMLCEDYQMFVLLESWYK